MRVVKAFFYSALLFFLSPTIALSDVIVHDRIAGNDEEVMLTAETRGKFFRKGGEVVEFFVDGKSIGKNLSGGDGFALKKFKVQKRGIYRITARSGKEEDNGLLLSLEKGDGIVFVDVEGGLLEDLFSMKPKEDSQSVIKAINRGLPIVLLQTGILSVKAIKAWLKESGFIELPVVPWRQGRIFEEINEKGLKIKAIIGSPSVIESAREYKARSFSFQEAEDAVVVKDWKEIEEKIIPPQRPLSQGHSSLAPLRYPPLR